MPVALPLEGLRVVELSAFVAAPLGGATLARLGADVIRIDQLGGGIDAQRWPLGPDGRSLYWSGLNRGKRSVALDLRSERGRDVAVRLAARAATVLTNLPARGPLGFAALRERRPDLVMVRITGGDGGTAAVDYTVNAGTGFPWITGPEEAVGPVNHVLPAWDVAAGYRAAAELLAADRRRLLTGQGGEVVISLAEVALRVADHLGYLEEARLLPSPRGRHGNDVYGTYGRDFATADGRRVMVLALTPRQWRSLAMAAGLEPDAIAPDLRLEGERWRHRAAIGVALEAWIGQRTLAEVGTAFNAQEVLWGPYRTFQQVLDEDPRAAEMLAGHGPDPVLGADTEAVLSAEGEDLLALRAAHVIA
ncbi:MAG: CoA transferase [Candidatus Dormibacteraeota bacterium]|nr:CoA transferase [Candidatus Dormibacteraeota bacterium]